MPERRQASGYKNSLNDATTDEATIRAWWKTNAWNIGGVPGPKFAVVDIDPRKDGETQRVAALGDLPQTLVVETGEYEVGSTTVRGEHRWYVLPEGVAVPKKIGDVES